MPTRGDKWGKRNMKHFFIFFFATVVFFSPWIAAAQRCNSRTDRSTREAMLQRYITQLQRINASLHDIIEQHDNAPTPPKKPCLPRPPYKQSVPYSEMEIAKINKRLDALEASQSAAKIIAINKRLDALEKSQFAFEMTGVDGTTQSGMVSSHGGVLRLNFLQPTTKDSRRK